MACIRDHDDHLNLMTRNLEEFQLGRTDDGRIHAPEPMESISAKRMRCPNCNRPAIAPMVSTYLRECIVENDWVCSGCGFEWSSTFNGLLV
jgi:hypothetical protein